MQALGPRPRPAATVRRGHRRRCRSSTNIRLLQHSTLQQIPAGNGSIPPVLAFDCLLHGIASPWSPVASLEDEEEDEKESVKASSQQEPQQQDVTQQQQNVTVEASSQRQRGKRARSVEASSLNPSTSASRKSLAWKYFKSEVGEVSSSAVKQKTSMVEHRARTTKFFRSLVMPCRSTGMRLMLFPRRILSPTPSPPPDTLIRFTPALGQRIDIELTRDVQRCGIISVLFETPSGFAIFIMRGGDLKRPDAMKDIWAYFGLPDRVEKFVLLCEFREFKHKSSAINDTGLSFELAQLIMRWYRPGQKLAVGKPEYKGIIERTLGIPCLFDEIVMEVMWGLQNLMHFLVPQEKMKLRNEDRTPMSQGLKMLLNRYGFDVKPEMVNDRIIMMACILVDCEFCDEKHSKPLWMAAANLKDLSGIDSEDWDLMTLATTLKIICYPVERTISEAVMFTQDEVKTFVRDAHKYEGKIGKDICLNAYYEIVRARKNSASIRKIMENMLPAYEGEQN